MREERGTYASSNETDKISYYICTPDDGEIKGVVQLSHGMCEYIGRYGKFFQELTRAGYAACGNDHLGHGDTAASAEDYGYFAPKNGWRYLVRDVKRLTDLMKDRYGDVPYYIIGHSMGSFIVRQYLTWYSDGIDGAVIMGTSGGIAPKSTAKLLTGFLENTQGERYRAQTVTARAMDLIFNIKFENGKEFGHAWISSDSEEVRRYEEDEKCNFVFTIKAYQDLLMLLESVSAGDWAESLPCGLPVLLLSGEMDPVGDYGKGVTKVYKRLQEAGVRDIRLKLYPEARHEILNDFTRDEVYADVLDWLAQHPEKRATPAL